jgi:hypothetical protein
LPAPGYYRRIPVRPVTTAERKRGRKEERKKGREEEVA